MAERLEFFKTDDRGRRIDLTVFDLAEFIDKVYEMQGPAYTAPVRATVSLGGKLRSLELRSQEAKHVDE